MQQRRWCVVHLFTLFLVSWGDIAAAAGGPVSVQKHHRNTPQHHHVDAVDDDDHIPLPRNPPSCRLILAKSSLPDAGWGMYTLIPRSRGEAILSSGDVVLQVVDLNVTTARGMRLLLQDYAWDAHETGGQYEAIQVISVSPGVGSLANGHVLHYNALPFPPTVDEGGLTRDESPGAGAISHYHNYTFYAQSVLREGDELLLNYGVNWFQERKAKLASSTGTNPPVPRRKSRDWLLRHGLCLDNLRPGPSRIPHAGRGAFATRALPQSSIVAPIPVLPIAKSALEISRLRSSGLVQSQQLLLNYCFGHANSSLLLYPMSSVVNFINHAPTPAQANVKLQWSTSTEMWHRNAAWLNLTVDQLLQLNFSGLLFELVATQDIVGGDEILLDYGPEWQQAWSDHASSRWKARPEPYTPSFVMDDVVRVLRTEVEQKEHPYPDNVFTSCYYRYGDHKAQVEAMEADRGSTQQVTTFPWNVSQRMLDMRYLRPCSILRRDQVERGGGSTLYTVRMRNRYGLQLEERIPNQRLHIVTQVPRFAIRFSDKLYTTDQHLDQAFRHEISIPDDLVPMHWKE